MRVKVARDPIHLRTPALIQLRQTDGHESLVISETAIPLENEITARSSSFEIFLCVISFFNSTGLFVF